LLLACSASVEFSFIILPGCCYSAAWQSPMASPESFGQSCHCIQYRIGSAQPWRGAALQCGSSIGWLAGGSRESFPTVIIAHSSIPPATKAKRASRRSREQPATKRWVMPWLLARSCQQFGSGQKRLPSRTVSPIVRLDPSRSASAGSALTRKTYGNPFLCIHVSS
jgi:hypothetical protein